MKLLQANALLLSLLLVLVFPVCADVLHEYQLKKAHHNFLLRKYAHAGWTLVEVVDSEEVDEVSLLGEPLLVGNEVFVIIFNTQDVFTFVGDPSTAHIRHAEACLFPGDTEFTLTLTE